MTDEQIDKMLEMHRYLIKCELNTMVAKINREKDTELLQEAFESLVLNELFDKIHYEMGGPASPMPYTNVEQLEDVEIDFEDEEDDD